MKTLIEMLRFYLAELLLGWAFNILPPGREQREMAIFIQHSWITRLAKSVDPNEKVRAKL